MEQRFLATRARPAALLLLAGLGVLVGCGVSQSSRRGASAPFSREVRSFTASVEGGPALCPGQRVRVVVTAVFHDGARASREPDREGFTLRTTGALFTDESGRLFLVRDPVRLEEAPLGIQLELTDRPDLPPVVLPLSARFDCEYRTSFHGEQGAPGEPGTRGGSPLPGPGAPPVWGHDARFSIRGGYGRSGGPGGEGGSGQPGARVEVVMTRVPRPGTPRLKVLVRDMDSDRRERFLVDVLGWPDQLIVDVSGGLGGRGGKGGDGGAGGRGAEGWPPIQAGEGGMGGRGGRGGQGGAPGRVLVRASPEAAPYLFVLGVYNIGPARGPDGSPGEGGPGGDAIEAARRGKKGERGWRDTSSSRGSFVLGPPVTLGPPPDIRIEPVPEPW